VAARGHFSRRPCSGVPLANYYAPDLNGDAACCFNAEARFILGVLFFPFVWIICGKFIKRSIALRGGRGEIIKR